MQAPGDMPHHCSFLDQPANIRMAFRALDGTIVDSWSVPTNLTRGDLERAKGRQKERTLRELQAHECQIFRSLKTDGEDVASSAEDHALETLDMQSARFRNDARIQLISRVMDGRIGDSALPLASASANPTHVATTTAATTGSHRSNSNLGSPVVFERVGELLGTF